MSDDLIIRPIDLPARLFRVAGLCWDYRHLLITRTTHLPGMVERYYSRDDYTALIDQLPDIHARPKGDILVAELGGEIVGCAMYYQHHTGDCEVKRIFVAPAARGHGAGKTLLLAAMARAKADGHSRMMLDTVHTLTEAIAMYKHVGFRPCPPFYEPDPAFVKTLRFFDVRL